MIEGLKPCAHHRATGVYWLPQIPSHWEIMRSKHVFAERTELARAGDVQLSATQAYGVIPQTEFEKRVGRRVVRISMHLDKRSHVEKGDFVISMRSFQGGLERAWASGAIRSSYVVLRPACDLDLGYFTHLFKAQPYIKALQATGNFIRDGQDLTYGNFSRVDLPFPPRDEQIVIGRFLDHTNRRIDQFIRGKKKLIALLNEQKQAIIQRAVTRGPRHNARLKDSGVPWLGQVPAHWHVTRLKFEASHIIDCLHATPPYRPDGVFPAIRTADVEPGRLRLARVRRLAEADFVRWTQRLEPAAGDILYTREGERFGLAALVPAGVRLCISQRMMVLRIRPSQHSAYIMWQLNCPHVYQQASEHIVGSTSPHVNVEQIRNYLLVLPPRTEQQQIVDHIDAELAAIAPALLRAEKEIALAREYRTRLVTDVVTGQFDVRAAAASLPGLEPEIALVEASDDEEADIDDSEAA